MEKQERARYSLAQFVRRVDLFGPECVMQTARELGDLTPRELQELGGYIAHRERVGTWTRGEWVPKRSVLQPRACEGCGLDLPVNATARRQFHDAACRMRAARGRVREREANVTNRAGVRSVA